jgi:hypothetical protein
MYKEAGICVDAPFYDFFDGEFGNGVKEQNLLSMDASKGFLEGIFGMSGSPDAPGQGFGRNGIILTGHDHEGCDVYHYINQSSPPEREWKATRWENALSTGLLEEDGIPGLRAVTVRSMMGDFAGNAGLMSLWFDEDAWDWRFEFVNCGLGTQHIWWLVHILDLITIVIAVVYAGFVLVGQFSTSKATSTKTLTNGHLKVAKKGLDIKQNGVTTPASPKVNGNLQCPESEKKSLKKKKSKLNVAGVTQNGSAASSS